VRARLPPRCSQASHKRLQPRRPLGTLDGRDAEAGRNGGALAEMVAAEPDLARRYARLTISAPADGPIARRRILAGLAQVPVLDVAGLGFRIVRAAV
jgi:hypothetical protein